MKKYLWLLCLLLLSIIVISSKLVDNSFTLLYRIYGAIIMVIGVYSVLIIIAIVLLKTEIRSKSKVLKTNMSNRYDDVLVQELSKYGIEFNEFKTFVYEKFKSINMAFSKFDKCILKANLTDDLYSFYVEELEKLAKKKEKNIIKDFELINLKIYDVKDAYGRLTIDVYLNVRMFDYIIETESGNCIFGNDMEKHDFEFELTFIKNMSLNSDFVMSKKICINEMDIKKKDKCM